MNQELFDEFTRSNIKIYFDNESEYIHFMSYLEKNTGILWNSGCKPTEFGEYSKDIFVSCYRYRLSYGTNSPDKKLINSKYMFEEGKIEEMLKFKVGDKVKVIENTNSCIIDKKGIIKYTDISSIQQYLIEFDEPIMGGHDGGGRCKNNHGWYINEKDIIGVEEFNSEVEVELIKYINKVKKRKFTMSEPNKTKITQTVNFADSEDIQKFKDFIDSCTYIDLFQICDNYLISKLTDFESQEVSGTPVEMVSSVPYAVEASESINVLEKAMAKIFMDSKADLIKDELTNKIFEQAKQKIEEEYGVITKKIKLELDNKVIDLGTDIVHEKFDTILKFVKQDEPVFLVGEAGTGKNYICKQVAKALGLDFYFSNAVTQEYKLTGFTDAMGKYQESQFYKAFKNGGLFMLDEMDASIPEVLIILNAAIANRYFDFPAPIGYVEAHPDFRVVAAGNTMGEGASYTYVGRSQLDGASLDRFAMVKITYDKQIDLRCANGDLDLVDFIRELRKIANQKKIQIILSYRAISRISKMLELLGLEDTLKTCLFKTLNKKEIYTIYDNFRGKSIYKDCISKIHSEMSE